MSYKLEINNKSTTDILEISYNSRTGSDSEVAKITIPETSTTESFSLGDDAKLYENGNIIFRGTYEGHKQSDDKGFIDLKIDGYKQYLSNQRVNRLFIREDTGDIIKSAINKKSSHKDKRVVYQGNSTTNVSTTNTEYFELLDADSSKYSKIGDNMVWQGWEKGTSSVTDTVTISNITDLKDGIDNLQIRIIDNISIQANVKIKLYAYSTEFIFNLDNSENRGNIYTFYPGKAEEINSSNRNGEIDIEVEINGEIQEGRAIGIDYIALTPYILEDRNINIDTSGINTTGRTISRRFDSSLNDLIEQLEKEDNYDFTVNEKKAVYRPSSKDKVTDMSIIKGSTDIVSVSENTDIQDVKNNVQIQAQKDKNINMKNPSSTEEYGNQERNETRVNTNIRTEQEAKSAAQGELKKTAFNKSTYTFSIMNDKYESLIEEVGNRIEVQYEDLNGFYKIINVNTSDERIVEVTIHEKIQV